MEGKDMNKDQMENLVAEMMDVPWRFRRLVREDDGQVLISPGTWVLKVLLIEGPQPMSSMAKRLGVTKQYVTAIVDRLAKDGLVERGHDNKDRRVVLVSLTSAGHVKITEVRVKVLENFSKRISTLNEEDQERLLQALRELKFILTKMEEPR